MTTANDAPPLGRFRWELINESAACCYQDFGHPFKPRPVAWVSVADAETLHRCMVAVEKALEYGKVPPEIRAALREGSRP